MRFHPVISDSLHGKGRKLRRLHLGCAYKLFEIFSPAVNSQLQIRVFKSQKSAQLVPEFIPPKARFWLPSNVAEHFLGLESCVPCGSADAAKRKFAHP